MKAIQCQCIPDVDREEVHLFVKTTDGWIRLGVLYNTDMSIERIMNYSKQIETLLNTNPIDIP